MAGLGIQSKAAVRIESDQGLVSAEYPTTVAEADAEEVLLDGYDQVPFMSEGVEESFEFEQDETLLGSPAIIASDLVALMGGGSLECQGYYDGLDALIACSLGFEAGRATASPDSVNPTALSGGTMAAGTWVDAATPFASGDVGKFIRVTSGAAEGQVRRISAFTNSSTVTITPNWDSTPAAAVTAEMDQEFEHLFEMSKRLDDSLQTDEDSSYPTGGVGTASDKIIRRLTLGILKQSAVPWIWRSVMVNSMTMSFSAKSGLTFSFDLVPFDLDKSSSTNTTGTAANWSFSESGLFTPAENQRILFNHLGGNGFLRIDAFSNGAMTSADEYGISEFSITVNNNLKSDDQSALTTPYRIQPDRGGFREVSGSFTLPRYSADTFFAWQSAETILQSHIKFAGSTIASGARAFEIFLSSFKLEGGSAPVGGPDVLSQSFAFKGLIPASAPTFIASGNPTQIITAPRSELMVRTTNQNPFNMFRMQQKEY